MQVDLETLRGIQLLMTAGWFQGLVPCLLECRGRRTDTKTVQDLSYVSRIHRVQPRRLCGPLLSSGTAALVSAPGYLRVSQMQISRISLAIFQQTRHSRIIHYYS